MKCYNHNEKDAIAICKSCGKGLCSSCLTELPYGIACKNKCEDRVNLVNKITDNNIKIISVSNRQIKTFGYFSIIFGVLFIILGIYFALDNILVGSIFIALGILFVLNGLFRLNKKSTFPSVANKNSK